MRFHTKATNGIFRTRMVSYRFMVFLGHQCNIVQMWNIVGPIYLFPLLLFRITKPLRRYHNQTSHVSSIFGKNGFQASYEMRFRNLSSWVFPLRLENNYQNKGDILNRTESPLSGFWTNVTVLTSSRKQAQSKIFSEKTFLVNWCKVHFWLWKTTMKEIYLSLESNVQCFWGKDVEVFEKH